MTIPGRYGLSLVLILISVSMLLTGCSNEVQSVELPVGEPVTGVTLQGPLQGKKAYRLSSQFNLPDCWVDSAHWTGSELYFSLSGIDFSRLLTGKYTYVEKCVLPDGQVDMDFDIYRAVQQGNTWNLSAQNINSDGNDAGMSLSGNSMAFVVYHALPGSWDIYFSKRNQVSWNAPEAFEKNTSCKEDNPEIYANGNRLIFESNRIDPEGQSCAQDDSMRLWISEKINNRWMTPVLLAGAPNYGKKNTQPWVDEENNFLYWTDDKGCSCIKRIGFDGRQVSGEPENVIVPDIGSLADGTADGKVVFVGEYSHAGDYAVFTCAIASSGGPFLGKWSVSVNICMVPLGDKKLDEKTMLVKAPVTKPSIPEAKPAVELFRCNNPRPDICSKEYRPVCGYRDSGVRCVSTPCDNTQWKTYSNGCDACSDRQLQYYRAGACGNDNISAEQ